MRNLFPPMYDCPETQNNIIGWCYWIVYFFLLPSLLMFLWMALGPTEYLYAWMCVIYFVLNALAVSWIFWDYLKDSFWVFRYSIGDCMKTVLWGLLALTVLQIPVFLIGAKGDFYDYISWISPFPLADTLFQIPTKDSMDFYPWLTVPFYVTLVPFTMSFLYLTVGFAPSCVKRSWVGYLIVAAMAWVSCVFFYLYMGDTMEGLWGTFLSVLPFWLCACWVYQKTDTVWTPMIFHAVVNLISVMLYLFV